MAFRISRSALYAWLTAEVAWRGSQARRAVRIWNTFAGALTLGSVSWLVRRASREHQALLAAEVA